MSAKKCGVCGNEGTQLCSGCNNKRYCSRECQKSDWKSHKSTCQSDVIKYTLMNQNLANTLARIPPFMEVAASICYLHYGKKSIIIFSFIETGEKSWKCKVGSMPAESPSTTPEGHYSFIIKIGETNTDMKTSMAIPTSICRSDCAKTFGIFNYKLPLNLQINTKRGVLGDGYSVVVSDEHDRIIKILSSSINKINV